MCKMREIVLNKYIYLSTTVRFSAAIIYLQLLITMHVCYVNLLLWVGKMTTLVISEKAVQIT